RTPSADSRAAPKGVIHARYRSRNRMLSRHRTQRANVSGQRLKVLHCTYRNVPILRSHKSPTNSPSHYSMQPDAAMAAAGPAAPPLRPVMPAVVPTSAPHLIDARESAVSWLYSQLAVGFTVHAWAGCAFTPMSPTMAS